MYSLPIKTAGSVKMVSFVANVFFNFEVDTSSNFYIMNHLFYAILQTSINYGFGEYTTFHPLIWDFAII